MQPFGKTSRGQAVEVYTLSNANGMAVDILTYGGAPFACLTATVSWRM